MSNYYDKYYQNTEAVNELQDKELFKTMPIKLSWHDLSYSVSVRKTENSDNVQNGKKQLLKPQNGYVNSGETLFIMGSSGAGKTTLLNALCDRISKGKGTKFEGKIMINDSLEVSSRNFRKYGAYVMQDDALLPTLTCEETIKFAARLKLNIKGQELKAKVEEILESLSLLKCRNTYIGNGEKKGLSGGERKRVSIGVELVANPSLLFLDEPTSGLDSFTAHKIVDLLHKQAQMGRAVVSTIHQPSSKTFKLFDRLLLLMDGNPIFQGPADESMDYFTFFNYQTPRFMNPADYYLKKFYVPYKKSEKDIKNINTLVEGYQSLIDPYIVKKQKELQHEEVTMQMLEDNSQSAGFFTQFHELNKRAFKNFLRDMTNFYMRISQLFVIIVLVICTFWDLGNGPSSVTNKAGMFNFVSVNENFTPFLSCLLVFMIEKPVFMREHANGTYGLVPYFFSKTFVELPLSLIFPILFSMIVYFPSGLTPDFERYLIFILILTLSVITSTSIAFLFGSIFTDPGVATNVATTTLLPMILYAGFAINIGDMPSFSKWALYHSFLRYSNEALQRNEFEDNPDYDFLAKPIYDTYHYGIGMWNCLLILLCYALVLRLGALLCLKLSIRRFY
ncbi:unnamed protein product [Moneuplotes crassus]|uniref:ABC transporter domain-containing protein n=1 Tax=Euplotes crassus TaxID=5936 RepID=A0AAD1X5Z1_EUPCR|nr:unnamed protein product [Moneuplotes crassus]